MTWKREGAGGGEESDNFAIVSGERKIDQSTRYKCYPVTFNPCHLERD